MDAFTLTCVCVCDRLWHWVREAWVSDGPCCTDWLRKAARSLCLLNELRFLTFVVVSLQLRCRRCEAMHPVVTRRVHRRDADDGLPRPVTDHARHGPHQQIVV